MSMANGELQVKQFNGEEPIKDKELCVRNHDSPRWYDIVHFELSSHCFAFELPKRL